MRGMRRREVGVWKERRRGNAEKVCRSMEREKEEEEMRRRYVGVWKERKKERK